jgi:dolichol-phosphate mannosyltransferase
MKEKKFISVVAYAHNSEKTVVQFLESIHDFLKNKFDSLEIIVVNDASTDKTLEQINQHKQKYNGKVTVISTAWKHNCELAMLAGIEMAIGDFIYEIDSTNLEFPVDSLWEAYQKSATGFDVVFASPNSKLNTSSRIFYKILGKFSYQKLDLRTESFKLITRRALNAILKSKDKNRYRKIIYRSSGFPTAIIFFKPTKKIQSNMTLQEKISLATDILLSFSDIGLKLTLFLSLLFFIISVSIGIYTVLIYLTERSIVIAGWTTTMLFLSFSFSGMFLILAILGKYLTIILEETKERPSYFLQSIKRIR